MPSRTAESECHMTESLAHPAPVRAVFEHEKRRDWGIGVLAWETKDKRGYVFEDGQLRVLAEPFFGLMREVDRPLDEVQALLACLKPELDAAREEQHEVLRSPHRAIQVMPFDEQVALFRAAFADGFDDPEWVERCRGTSTAKRAPAHRDAAVAEAQEKLGLSSLKPRMRALAFQSIHQDLVSVARATDLIPASETSLLETTDANRQRALAIAFADLLHGSIAFAPRLDHFLMAFQQEVGAPAGWQLATSFLALLEPTAHVSVRPPAFRAQAKWMAPRLSIPKLPNASSYLRCLSMAKQISVKLGEHGERPRDLLDVHDFVRATTRPEARRQRAEKARSMP